VHFLLDSRVSPVRLESLAVQNKNQLQVLRPAEVLSAIAALLLASTAFTIERYEISGLVERVWQLRNNHTTYDACYLALAEALAAPLYTCDHRLAQDRHTAHVKVFPHSH
jgi:predicted nucleic acid-binding protein